MKIDFEKTKVELKMKKLWKIWKRWAQPQMNQQWNFHLRDDNEVTKGPLWLKLKPMSWTSTHDNTMTHHSSVWPKKDASNLHGRRKYEWDGWNCMMMECVETESYTFSWRSVEVNNIAGGSSLWCFRLTLIFLRINSNHKIQRKSSLTQRYTMHCLKLFVALPSLWAKLW